MNSLRARLARFDPSLNEQARAPRVAPSSATLDAMGFLPMPGGSLRRVFDVQGLPRPSDVGAALWSLAAETKEPPPQPWIVLDTETTGLASGTGTLVFLVGWVEWWDDQARVVQLFMPEPANESELLSDTAAALDAAGAIISYNGKGFDLPRLRSRWMLQRRRYDDSKLPHLDLLYPCRRLTRGWLADARLATVEAALLGMERQDDLPGAEVPDVYRAYLRGEAGARVDRVVEHNAHDVIHLTRLAATLSRLLDDDDAVLPAASRLALARWRATSDDLSASRARLEPLCSEQGGVGEQALWLLAQLERRARDFESAHARLLELTKRAPHWLEAKVALAKLQEHRLKDLRGARRTVLAALEQQRRTADLGGSVPSGRMRALRHRLTRIERKWSAR